MERVLSKKINFLNENFGYEIVIVTVEQMGQQNFFHLNPAIVQYNLDVNFNGHFSENLLKKTFLHKKKLRKYKKTVTQIIAKEQPDVCISTFGKDIEFITKLNDKSRKIGEVHFSKNFREQFLTARKNNVLWKYLGKIRTSQLIQSTKKLDKLVVLTKADEKNWQKTNNNIVQIYNPNPLTTFEKSDCENKKVIAVGRLDAQKGYDYLIETWKIVAQQHSDWILDIWGDGELREKLAKQIVKSKLENQVFLRGTTTDIENKYLESSFYVMTSRYEGFPMVLIEAMSCGLPCVSFDCQWGPNEIINNGENGFLVPLGDSEQLAEKINLLITDGKLRKRMSENAKKTAENYEIGKIMEQWNDLFLSLK
jgi:glycosyltransferase involved in cell wall biosynthesis